MEDFTPTKIRKLKRKVRTSQFATWNVQGKLWEPSEIEKFARDMRNRNIQICAIQETRNSGEYEYRTGNTGQDDLLIFLGRQKDRGGGLGFYVHKDWVSKLASYQLVNERIAVIRFFQDATETIENKEKKGKARRRKPALVIINVYGHTQMKADKEPGLTEKFYEDLRKVYAKERNGADLIFILGDFNAKIGQKLDDEEDFMGNHGKGTRNENGKALQSFLEETNLYLVNTHFKHRPMQIATWHSGTQEENKVPPDLRKSRPGIHNQIDYIVAPKREIRLFSNARAIVPYQMEFRSDHSLVVASIELGALYKFRAAPERAFLVRRDVALLARDEETRERYQERVAQRLAAEKLETATAEEHYETIKKILNEAMTETLPPAPTKINGRVHYSTDPVLLELSIKQQRLTKSIYRRADNRNDGKRQRLKKKRNKIFKAIRKRIQDLERLHLENQAKELEESIGARAMYESVRVMQKNRSRNFKLHGNDGNVIKKVRTQLKKVTGHYRALFNKPDMPGIEEWIGEPRPLNNPITAAEVALAAGQIKNNRAWGPDWRPGEQVKYGGNATHDNHAQLLNKVFERHESIPEVKAGYLFPFNKPGKPCTLDAIRPLTFVVVLRKITCGITLNRFFPKVAPFLSPPQHAYLPGRSAGEIVWTKQWFIAAVERYNERAKSNTVDLSKAFDSMKRGGERGIMWILELYNLADEDERRLIAFLLSKTTLKVKIGNSIGEMFETSIGTPQGDTLSPILFLIYLEHIMRTIPAGLAREDRDLWVAYADDVEAIMRETREEIREREAIENHEEDCSCVDCRCVALEQGITHHFKQFNMTVNDKTFRGEMAARVRKLGKTVGSWLDAQQECEMRVLKAETAFSAYRRLWVKGLPVSMATRVKIYNGVVLPHFTYNAAATAYRQRELDKLDAKHRAQLRKVAGVFYPNHLSNVDTYEQTKAEPISMKITRARWTLLGHISRREGSLPANRATTVYFQTRPTMTEERRTTTRRGRVLTTIPRLLSKDILRLSISKEVRTTLIGVADLASGTDLAVLRQKAQNREMWKKIVTKIVEAAYKEWKKRNAKISDLRRQRLEQAAERVEQTGSREQTGRGRGRGQARGRVRGRGRGTGGRSSNAEEEVNASQARAQRERAAQANVMTRWLSQSSSVQATR